MLIYLKGHYTILGRIEFLKDQNEFNFTLKMDNTDVLVTIIPQDKKIESTSQFEISEELLNILKSGVVDGSTLPKETNELFLKMSSTLSAATRKVMHIVKYGLNQKSIAEGLFSVKDYFWSLDNSNWNHFPMTLSAAAAVDDFVRLNANNSVGIQKYIDDNFEPFFALYHLHLAKNTASTRSKWINATIAAELAIKEFLLRKEPKLEALLLEVPSPPLSKLYGRILEEYAGVKSPKRKELIKGVETRNKLIHRPENYKIDLQDALIYIQDVEIAIFHLVTLLYPSDQFAKKFYNKTIIVKKSSNRLDKKISL